MVSHYEEIKLKLVSNLVESVKSRKQSVMNGEIRSIKKLSNSRKRNIPRENSEENVPSVKGETKIDFAERQKRLNEIGSLGEEIVVKYEKNRLANYPNLARKVKQASLTDDSLGYDIR